MDKLGRWGNRGTQQRGKWGLEHSTCEKGSLLHPGEGVVVGTPNSTTACSALNSPKTWSWALTSDTLGEDKTQWS